MKTMDKNKKILEIGVIDNASFELVVKYIYGRNVHLNRENVVNFLRTVDYLGIEREFIF